MGWVTDHAPEPFDVNTCIQCGLCLPSCPTFRITGSETASPRGRLTAMAAVEQGFAVDEGFADIMGTCLQCRACEVVCPAFVPFGKAMEGARAEVQAQLPGPGHRMRRLLLDRGLRSPRLLRLASIAAWLIQKTRAWFLVPRRLRTGLRGLRPQIIRSAGLRTGTGTGAKGTAALLTGCVMDSWFPGVHQDAADVLEAAGYRVVVPRDQTCCGALAAHDGWAAEAQAMAATNVAAFRDADIVVVDSAGCGAHMKDYEHWTGGGEDLAAKVMDITEVVAAALDAGELPSFPEAGSVAIQDPCHLRHAQRVVRPPRRVLEGAGVRPVEIDPSGQCCGAAGIYSLLQPDLSGELGRRKAEQIRVSGETVVASANPGCEMQIRAHAAVDVVHPIEVYAEALRRDGGDRART